MIDHQLHNTKMPIFRSVVQCRLAEFVLGAQIGPETNVLLNSMQPAILDCNDDPRLIILLEAFLDFWIMAVPGVWNCLFGLVEKLP